MIKKYSLLFILTAALCVFPFPAFSQGTEYLSDSLTEIGSVKIGDKITIAGFYFEAGSTEINANLKKYIQNAARQISKIKYKKIFVDGYTDNRGDNSANNKLSRERARGVRAELIKNGIPANKIQARAYGSLRPVASNDTQYGRVQNRRVEILIK